MCDSMWDLKWEKKVRHCWDHWQNDKVVCRLWCYWINTDVHIWMVVTRFHRECSCFLEAYTLRYLEMMSSTCSQIIPEKKSVCVCVCVCLEMKQYGKLLTIEFWLRGYAILWTILVSLKLFLNKKFFRRREGIWGQVKLETASIDQCYSNCGL